MFRALLFLLAVVVVSTRCDGESSKNDRMDDLISMMANMGKRVDAIYEKVEDNAKKVGIIDT